MPIRAERYSCEIIFSSNHDFCNFGLTFSQHYFTLPFFKKNVLEQFTKLKVPFIWDFFYICHQF